MKVLIAVGVVLFMFFLFVIINYSNDKTYEKYKYKFFTWNTYVIYSIVYVLIYFGRIWYQCKNRSNPDTDVGVRPDAKTEFNRTVKRS